MEGFGSHEERFFIAASRDFPIPARISADSDILTSRGLFGNLFGFLGIFFPGWRPGGNPVLLDQFF